MFTSWNILIEFVFDRILGIRVNPAVQFNIGNQFKKLVKIVETFKTALFFLETYFHENTNIKQGVDAINIPGLL